MIEKRLRFTSLAARDDSIRACVVLGTRQSSDCFLGFLSTSSSVVGLNKS